MKSIHFKAVDKPDFYSTLRTRVNNYFAENKKSKNANAFMIFKATFYLTWLTGSYAFLVFGNISNPFLSYALWASIGLAAAFVAVNVCHDAIHGAFTTNKTVNVFLRNIFNVVGANEYIWNIMHNIVHHTYTNIPDHDEDLEIVGIMRLSPAQPLKKIHRYQYIYAFGLYSFATLLWVFVKDFKKFRQEQIGNYEVKHHPKSEVFKLFFFKAVYYALFIVLPFVFIPMAWYHIVLGFVVMHLFEGFVLAMIFMLAHVVDGTEFPEPNEKGQVDISWAELQLRTTANFCRNSAVVSFFCGGLNYQVEHHLFSKICHIHYPKISHIVEETAKEYGLPYLEYPTLGKAIGAHITFLKKIGGHSQYANVEPVRQAEYVG